MILQMYHPVEKPDSWDAKSERAGRGRKARPAEGMLGSGMEENRELAGGGRLAQLRGRRDSQIKRNIEVWLAQLRGRTQRAWGVDRELAGGGRQAQLRGRQPHPAET